MTSVQELTAVGKDMGLTGTALVDFVKEQQAMAREERAAQRALEQERLAFEEKEKEKVREAEREAQRLRFELEKEKLRVKAELGTAESGSRHSSIHEEEGESFDNPHNRTPRSYKFKGPKMTPFDDKDEMDSYLHRFEQYATIHQWEASSWAVYLAALLRGKALDVYARLPTDQSNNYDVLKDALLRRYNKTEEGYKQQFHTCKAETGESPQQFIVRLTSYLSKWIKLAKINETFEGLQTLIVREQFLSTCSKDLEVFLRERAITDLTVLAKLAEQYLDAHKHSSLSANSRTPVTTGSKQAGTQPKASGPTTQQAKRCYNCNRTGHIAKFCRQPGKAAGLGIAMEDAAGMEVTHPKSTFTQSRPWQNQRPQQRYPSPPQGQPSTNTRAGTFQTEPPTSVPTCRAHNLSSCRECLNITESGRHPACNALLLDQVELKCGCTLPVIMDACQAAKGKVNMPTVQGFVNGQPAEVLRDTGCSTVVVRRSLVLPEQLTGRTRACVLIDGTIRWNPTATITIDTPYLSGKVEAVCMSAPLYALIIGNVQGAKDPEEMEALQAVTTRSMAIKQSQPVTPLPVMAEIDMEVTRDDLIRFQHEDTSLTSLWEEVPAQNPEELLSQGKAVYFTKSDLLYRKTRTETGREITQFVVPTAKLREKVVKIAHETALSGHQGINRTKLRIYNQFWWPHLPADVARFCKSCDICQRTISKGRIPNVPLGSMPIIETPFERIAIDLIGPIHPVSDRGHRYILTIIDYATRYPEAVALKDIQTETVAEALVDIFTRVGIPKEVLSDQGTQFVSAVMKEVSRLLSIKQLVTSPYHPMCNGLVEKFNGTLKTMLKRVCHEKPREWDRYLSSILFAYREVRQESLGYSPFELLYGRTVRGPMSILRELWTKQQLEPEVKTTYQYVVDLQNRLQETCRLATEELKKAQVKQIKQFNKKAAHREFKAGSKVLVLRPTDHNKLLMQWKGPYTILEHVRGYDYRIDMKGKPRLYHANMLKQYIEREAPEVGRALGDRNDDPEVMAAAVLEAQDSGATDLPTFQPLQKETWKEVDINPGLSELQKEQVRELLYEFSDIFTDVPKVTTLGEHQIHLTTNDPVYQKPYPLPYALRETLSNEIDTMLKLKVIEPSTSAYASPVVMIKKPDNSIRVCIDFRLLNKITVFDPEPMVTADEIFVKLAPDRYFSKFDLSKGYWQVPVRDTDKQYTAFTTHRGLFQCRTMPFGLLNAPATFCRIMRLVLKSAENLDNYLDDVLAHSRDWETQLQTLRDFFTRLRAANLALRPTKCSIGYSSLEFLGFNVGEGTLKPVPKKVEKVLQARRPETKAHLRSFLGLIGYYRHFIPHFAALAVPLTDLTKKNQPNHLKWGEAQENAFNTLRGYLVVPPVLHLPDLRRPFILQTDACREGIGAILMQEYDGIRYPIAFGSRKLLPREQNYSTIEQECLAVVWGIQKFENYLHNTHFVIETDHQPLQYLNRSRYQNGRLMRWSLELQPYRYTIRSIKGSQNVGADFLSRHSP